MVVVTGILVTGMLVELIELFLYTIPLILFPFDEMLD